MGEYGYNLLSRKQMKPTYTELDLGVVESIYCTFGATCRGKFYPGRNIDRQQQRILTVEQITGEELTSLWNLREKTINKKFLGEFSGWTGIDKERLKAYRDRGELLWHYENR